ncbi:MAG: GTP 3',8-cyclase MoaA [Clostridium sp.]|nr:GTP 3',8-cyclase MoaA [Clostridium sp.]
MKDNYGRTIDYMRISITDRCNLRCLYCMPEEGVSDMGHAGVLTFDEIWRLCRIFAKEGISRIKLTGGEPLVRLGVTDLVRGIKEIPGIDNVTMTTNGVLLASMYDDLADAGLDAVTISLDTLDEKTFQGITRRDRFRDVMEGIRYAEAAGRMPVKINTVPVPGVNDRDLVRIAEIARDREIHVRFIEMMPLGLGSTYTALREDELRRMLEKEFGPFTPVKERMGNGPCHYYSVPGFRGKLGFISAVSHKFCKDCNRVRLTSDGYLKTCLQYDTGADFRELLRGGASDQALQAAYREALRNKPRCHQFEANGNLIEEREKRVMSQIGG